MGREQFYTNLRNGQHASNFTPRGLKGKSSFEKNLDVFERQDYYQFVLFPCRGEKAICN